MKKSGSIWFIAQSGAVWDRRPPASNFHIYELAWTARHRLEDAIRSASVGSGGLEYQGGFLNWLSDQEHAWRVA